MPLQTWTKGQYPEGMNPIPEDQRVELETIRDLLSSLSFPAIRQNPPSAELSAKLMHELAERLDITQRALSYNNSFIAQQDTESVRQTVEDDADDLRQYVDIASGRYTSTDPEAWISTIERSVTSTIGDIQLILDDNGKA